METSLIIAAITAASTLVGYWFKWKSDKNSDKKKELLKAKSDELLKNIDKTEEEIVIAMETNITDVPGLRLKLDEYRRQLSKIIGIIAILLTLISVTGCGLFRKEMPVIVGERVFYMKEGQSMVVPALKSPAKQWYLIDDVAMLKVLGVDKPIEKTVIGVTKE